MHNTLKIIIILLVFLLITKAYMLVACHVGERIVDFFEELWHKVSS